MCKLGAWLSRQECIGEAWNHGRRKEAGARRGGSLPITISAPQSISIAQEQVASLQETRGEDQSLNAELIMEEPEDASAKGQNNSQCGVPDRPLFLAFSL